jgi:hypothetical protein
LKEYLLTFILMLAVTVSLQWGGSEGATGYLLYARSKYVQALYDYNAPIWTGARTATSVILDDGMYCFVVRAENTSGKSGDSNEACMVIQEPGGFRLLF